MNIIIRQIRRKDYKLATRFALEGMHFDWYFKTKLGMRMYAKYFWYLEINKATNIYGAYIDDKFVGCLIAKMNNKKRIHRHLLEMAYVKTIDFLASIFLKGGPDLYEKTNAEMLDSYSKRTIPDGEIVFLSVDPIMKNKGIGSALLKALIKDEKGKIVYLDTDDACDYLFYEYKGFVREEQRFIKLSLAKGDIPLNCYLYAKRL